MTFLEQAAIAALQGILSRGAGAGHLKAADDALHAAETLAKVACDAWGHDREESTVGGRVSFGTCKRCFAPINPGEMP